MPEDASEPEWQKFGIAAALSRQLAADQRSFLRLMAQTLESALPDQTRVEWRGLFHKTLHRVTVSLREDRYTLEDPGQGPLRAARTRVVRGIALKTEEIPVEEWLKDLGEELDNWAQASVGAREMLGRLFDS